jgi:hypothetical protein
MESAYSATSPGNPDGSGRANGYTNGGSDHDEHHDDSDDDDSNPLEDLEALGEKEERENEAKAERLREDEEGLRKAKELAQAAQQGWEENLKSHRQSYEQGQHGEADAEDGDLHPLDRMMMSAMKHRDDQLHKQRSDEDVRMPDDTSKIDDAVETIHVAPSYGGFRAVNEPSTAS